LFHLHIMIYSGTQNSLDRYRQNQIQ